MATSESDADFESADEELGRAAPPKRDNRMTYWTSPTTVDSESDDDTEYIQHTPCRSLDWQKRSETYRTTMLPDVATSQEILVGDKDDKTDSDVKVESDLHIAKPIKCVEKTSNNREDTSSPMESEESSLSSSTITAKEKDAESIAEKSEIAELDDDISKVETKTAKVHTVQQDLACQLGTKKLGIKIIKDNNNKHCITNSVLAEPKDTCLTKCSNEESLQSASKDVDHTMQEKSRNQLTDNQSKLSGINDLPEMDMPEELKSNKKFKEVFQPEGWEGLGDDIQLPDDLTEENLQPVIERLSLINKESESSLGNWGSWGNWGVTSLINTATASVSTLTSHVSQGLTLLEDTIGTQNPTEEIRIEQDETTVPDDAEPKIQEQENQSHSSFGFGNLMSGVSSITRLVESTGSKVMTGGLDTLEAIGKKTMEVLQDGDPGLKKKRAFFMNEPEKPNLSQILREAKIKAETEQKTIEERELTRKVHFESLFDDYQGLVHLEALEILSKQSNMKIQQHLIELDTDELVSVQETLEEIKELCDLGDEDDEDKNDKDLKKRLEDVCRELGIDITYEKLYNIWTETEGYLTSSSTHTDQEMFQRAISTLAQFTAFSVESFHKTAELLLIKERRNTVNEADALVQLTNILSDQITSLANSFCNTLYQFTETMEKPTNINANITTIFLEASNANTYIQDAFRLLIPILQVGAI